MFKMTRKSKEQILLDSIKTNSLDAVEHILSKTMGTNFRQKRASRDRKEFNLAYKTEDGMTFLHQAVLSNSIRIVRMLISSGVDVDIKDNRGFQPLHIAADRGYYDIGKLLITVGCQVDSPAFDGNSPLHLACMHGNYELVCLLLKNGANPLSRNALLQTPVGHGCEGGYCQIIEELLASRACSNVIGSRGDIRTFIEAIDSIGTPCLHLAAKKNQIEVIRLLLKHGADINVCNDDGSALHIASKAGSFAALRFLLQVGARSVIRNKRGETFADVQTDYRCQSQVADLFKMFRDARPYRMIKRQSPASSTVHHQQPRLLNVDVGDVVMIIEKTPGMSVWRGYCLNPDLNASYGYLDSDCLESITMNEFVDSLSMLDEERNRCSANLSEDSGYLNSMWSGSSHVGEGSIITFGDAAQQQDDLCLAATAHGDDNDDDYTSSRADDSGLDEYIADTSLACSRLHDMSADIAPFRQHSSSLPFDLMTSTISSDQFEQQPASKPVVSTTGLFHCGAEDSRNGQPQWTPPNVQRKMKRHYSHQLQHMAPNGINWKNGNAMLFSNRFVLSENPGVQKYDVDIAAVRSYLYNIGYGRFASNFIDAGYTLDIMNRVTPQDLTALGVSNSFHRKRLRIALEKIEVSKSFPVTAPDSVEEWLRAIDLSEYDELFAAQNIASMKEIVNVAIEDLEEIGLKKLGHQKRFSLAVKQLRQSKQLSSPESRRQNADALNRLIRVNSSYNRRKVRFMPEENEDAYGLCSSFLPDQNDTIRKLSSSRSNSHCPSMMSALSRSHVMSTSRASTSGAMDRYHPPPPMHTTACSQHFKSANMPSMSRRLMSGGSNSFSHQTGDNVTAKQNPAARLFSLISAGSDAFTASSSLSSKPPVASSKFRPDDDLIGRTSSLYSQMDPRNFNLCSSAAGNYNDPSSPFTITRDSPSIRKPCLSDKGTNAALTSIDTILTGLKEDLNAMINYQVNGEYD